MSKSVQEQFVLLLMQLEHLFSRALSCLQKKVLFIKYKRKKHLNVKKIIINFAIPEN